MSAGLGLQVDAFVAARTIETSVGTTTWQSIVNSAVTFAVESGNLSSQLLNVSGEVSVTDGSVLSFPGPAALPTLAIGSLLSAAGTEGAELPGGPVPGDAGVVLVPAPSGMSAETTGALSGLMNPAPANYLGGVGFGPVEARLDPDGQYPPPPGVELFPMIGAFLLRMNPQPSSGEGETDMNYAGALESLQAIDGVTSSTTEVVSNGARAAARSWTMRLTEPHIQVDSTSDIPATSGSPNVAITDGEDGESGPSAAGVDAVLAWEDGTAEPALSTPITAGGASLDILLGGSDVPLANDSRGLEQVAELVPLPESSLALAATLWTVSSGASGQGEPGDEGADGDRADDPNSQPSAAWAVFVTGVDQALDQTCRDLRDTLRADGTRNNTDQSARTGQSSSIEWQGTILPAARPAAPRARRSRPSASAVARPVERESSSQSESSTRPSAALASMPALSVVSIGTMIAGWLWKERKRFGFAYGKKAIRSRRSSAEDERGT
jgi:hypothetical protein